MEQLIFASSEAWDSPSGVLICLEKSGSEWQKVSAEIPVSFGKAGMGWGRGKYPDLKPGPRKQEGDGRSPAGLFALTLAFSTEPISIKMPYLLIDGEWECIDDPNSKYYNRFVRSSDVKKDWNSSEKMSDYPDLYKRGIVVDHNSNPTVPGLGSAIFMHKWSTPGAPTVGCTAMSAEHLESLLRWLDGKKKPHLLQLPRVV